MSGARFSSVVGLCGAFVVFGGVFGCATMKKMEAEAPGLAKQAQDVKGVKDAEDSLKKGDTKDAVKKLEGDTSKPDDKKPAAAAAAPADDAKITAAVKAALAKEKFTTVQVESKGGVVTLKGKGGKNAARAVELAKGTDGVKDVVSQVK